jgi:hypothetical protein
LESVRPGVGGPNAAPAHARLAAAHVPNQQPARQHRERSPLALAIVSMALGIPLSAIAVAAGSNPPGFAGLAVIWLAIAVINVAYSRHG